MPRLAVFLLCALLLSACSRVEFAYRNADWLLEYYATQAVSLSEPQLELWQPVLQTALSRHRAQELPLVIVYLDLADQTLQQTGGTPGAACLVDAALFLYRRHARLAVDLAVPLLADLDAAQVKHLARYTARRDRDAAERYLHPDSNQRQASRQQRFLKRVADWVGKLNDSQRKQIRDALERIPDLSPSWLAYRTQQTDALLGMLAAGADRESLQKHLEAWWVERAGATEETRLLQQAARDEFVRLMDRLATSLTGSQRVTLRDRLRGLRDNLAPFLPGPQLPAELTTVAACAAKSV